MRGAEDSAAVRLPVLAIACVSALVVGGAELVRFLWAGLRRPR